MFSVLKIFRKKIFNNISGFGIIELLVIIAIASIAFLGILQAGNLFIGSLENGALSLRASNLAEEAMEAVRSFRDNTDWDINGLGVLSTGTDYYPEVVANSWDINSGSENIGQFTRKINFSDVMRNGNSDIIASGGINDPNTKKATATIIWQTRYGERNFSLDAYFTNFQD